MNHDIDQAKARRAVRLARAELQRWERRFDLHSGIDSMRYVAEIRNAERRLADAEQSLRLLRDGRAERLPAGVDDGQSSPANRMPAR